MSDGRTQGSSSDRPVFQLHSPAVDFIENWLPQYHPAFDNRHVLYDPSQAQFVARAQARTNVPISQRTPSPMLVVSEVPPSPQRSPRAAPSVINEMTFWQDMFPKAMEKLRNEPTPSSITKPEWTIRQLSTWADVQARLDMARREYDFHHDLNPVGKVRRLVRSGLDNNVVTMQQGEKLVPEMDIAKPVVGAIRVVLDAYRKASEVREEITKSFEDLPEVFETIDFYVKTYQNDQSIATTSINLVHSIFVAIENAIAFYTSSQPTRAMRAVLSGSDYQKALHDSLLEVESRWKTLETQARLSLHHRVASDNDVIIQQNASVLQETGLAQHVLQSIYQNGQATNRGLAYFASLFNLVLPFLNDLHAARFSHSPVARTPSPLPHLIEAPPLWIHQDIQALIRIPKIDERDLQHVAAQAEFMLHEDRGRTQEVLQTHIFRNWMESRSARLLIHGNFRPPFDICPLSAVCTLLTHTFRSLNSDFISLVFFCGRHLVWDRYQGGLAMIQSLVDQLLRQFTFTPLQLDPRIYSQDLEVGNIGAWCELFNFLIRQLPYNKTVICLIDGIGLYETEDFLGDISVVIMKLFRLADEELCEGHAFKLLVTSPQTTLDVRKAFDESPDSVINLHNLPGIGGGMSAVSLHEQMVSDMGVGRW